MHSATLIDPGEAVAWVVVRSKFMITGFKRQSYLWVDGGEGECRRQRCDFRVQLWSLVAKKKKSIYIIIQLGSDEKV